MKITFKFVETLARCASRHCIKNSLLGFRATVASALVASLVACGGGGGGGGATPPPAAIASTPTYLHYSSAPTAANVGGTLTTIDPATPAIITNTNPALVGGTPAGRRMTYVSTGTIASGTISDMRRYAVVFSSGGVIKKQSAVVGASVPAAVQISSASGITSGPGDGTGTAVSTDLCTLETIDDIQTPDNSPVYYALAGTDRTCGNGDDVYSWMRLNTPAGTAPTPFAGIISEPVPIYNTSTLAITGYVALDASGALTKFDANLATPVAATNGAGPFATMEGLVYTTQNGHLLLLVGNSIRTYDPGTNTLGVTSLATVSQPGAFYYYGADVTNFYFVDSPAARNVIQRISLTTATPAAASPVVTEAAGAIINYFETSPNRLVYSMTSGGNNSIQSIVKTATNTTPSTRLYPAATTTDTLMLMGATSTGRVYMNRRSATGAVTSAVINDDATGLVTHADATWNTGFTDASFSIIDSDSSIRLSQVVLLQRNATGKTTDDGATLTAYDAATHTVGAVLGSLPADIQSMQGGYGFGPRVLITGYRTAFVGTDIFYVDVLSAGSLTRVTNDAAVEEVLF